jgi:hypothetical protein
VFLQNVEVPVIFRILELFSLKKYVEYVHDTVDGVHQRWLTSLRTSLNIGHWLPDRWLRLNQSNRYLSFYSRPVIADPRAKAAGSGWGRRRPVLVAAHHGRAWRLTRVRVFSSYGGLFRWGLLLLDHSDEGNVFMLTLIGGERQWSTETVRLLGQCLLTMRASSVEASAPRMCTKASSSSLLASRPTNCSDRRRKIRIWWLPRVQRVLVL